MTADPVAEALTELAAAAKANMSEWELVLRRIEAVLELRRQGFRYSDMRIDDAGTSIIESLGRNQERLNDAGARVRRAIARQLAAEGWSQSQIAAAFGVSRQRVAALLADD